MKKISKLILVLFTLVYMAGCGSSKDEPTPVIPSASFTSDFTEARVLQAIKFTNSSTNSESYLWEFGDGQTSVGTNPSKTYTRAGTFTVKLTATSSTGATSTSTSTIRIKELPTKARITKVTINNIPFLTSSGAGWDVGSGPDVYFQLFLNGNILFSSANVVINDVLPSKMPIAWDVPNTISGAVISPLSTVVTFSVRDSDVVGFETIGNVDMTFNNTSYPPTITKTQNNVTITLNVTWED
jgi:PKD repeat protein